MPCQDIEVSEKTTILYFVTSHFMRNLLFFVIFLAVCLFFTNRSEFGMRACDVIKSHFAFDAALENNWNQSRLDTPERLLEGPYNSPSTLS